MALSHLGIGKEVANMETEKSEEASAGRRFYDIALREILRDFPWPFATKIITLSLVATGPNIDWGYSYRYPVDCMYARRILSGIRMDNSGSQISYKIAQDSSGNLIFCDIVDAQLEYTVYTDNPALYPPDFTLTLSYYLAHLMAPRLTSGDQFGLGKKSYQLYLAQGSKAISRGSNEEMVDRQPEAESIRLRD